MQREKDDAMPTILVLLHTIPALVEPFSELCSELMPADVEVVHVADGMLLEEVLAKGGLS